MTGPELYQEALRLRRMAAAWMDADTGWRGELSGEERMARRMADLAEAQVCATLAQATAIRDMFPAPETGRACPSPTSTEGSEKPLPSGSGGVTGMPGVGVRAQCPPWCDQLSHASRQHVRSVARFATGGYEIEVALVQYSTGETVIWVCALQGDQPDEFARLAPGAARGLATVLLAEDPGHPLGEALAKATVLAARAGEA